MKVARFLFFISLFPILAYSQQHDAQPEKTLFWGPTVGHPVFAGNNFLNHSYTHRPSISLELGVNIYRNFGLSASVRYHGAGLQTTQYVGNSKRGGITEGGIFAFYLIPISDHWHFVPKVGVATFHLTNRMASDHSENYRYTSEGEIYLLRPEMHYFFNQRISLFSSLEYGYVDLSRIQVTRELRHLYRASHQFHLSVGVRLWTSKR